jgi:L-cysteine/cystine lyase
LSDLTHLRRVRQKMPATLKQIYLNSGTFGPLPACVSQTMQKRVRAEWRDGRLGTQFFREMADTYANARLGVARLLNADVKEIALTESTGDGLNIIGYGFNWQAGDEVITTTHEHLSGLAPLYQLRDRFGIIIRFADIGSQADQSAPAAIRALVTERTRLISISHVTWTTGTCLDVPAVAQLGRELGIPVLVDGAQAVGAIPVDVKALDVDFYAIPMQKWLCGPEGTGALYIKHESMHYVEPTYVGYWSVQDEENDEWELSASAQRFELGGRQTAALAGQEAVLNWLEQSVGYPWIFERIAKLSIYTYRSLQLVPGVTLLTPEPGKSGLVTFTLVDHDAADVVKQLQAEHAIQIRSIRPFNALRVSTGFYNTEAEIDTLVDALGSYT